MSNILRASVAIVGTRTVLWHVFGPDAIPLEKQERTGVAGNDPEEWTRSVLFTKDSRQLYFPATYAFGMMRDAAVYTKQGRGSLQKPLCATLQIETERLLFDRYLPDGELSRDEDDPVFLHVCGVRNPATKGRNVRYRVGASKGWRTEFTMLFDKTIVARDQIGAILEDASKLCGIGDGRGIGFGRFAIEKFSVE